MKVFLSAQAHRDIASIKAFIAERNPTHAESVAAELYGAAEKLSDSPRKGVALSAKFGIQTDLRMWVVSPNIILYKINDGKIIVTRVINERRDYLAVLGFKERINGDD